MRLSRNGRKVAETLLSLSKERQITPDDAWLIEQLVYTYPVNYIINSVKKYYNPDSKSTISPNTMAFYENPIRNKGKKVKKMSKEDWTGDHNKQAWIHLVYSDYLLTDYSMTDLDIFKEAGDMTPDGIKEGIKVGKENRVHSLAYAVRVAEKHKAHEDVKYKKMDENRGLFTTVETGDTHSRSRLELASMMAEWQNDVENMELKNKVDGLRRKKH